MERLSRRAELLDGELDHVTLMGNLRDLSRLNRWLGGASLSWRAVEPILREAPPTGQSSLLDVGTGAADIPRYLRRVSADRHPGLHITATDVRPEIVRFAREAAGEAGLQVRLAPPDRIEEPDGSFEVVHSSLLLHHLEPPHAAALLREMARVARRAVVVNDLDRRRRWHLLARLLTRMTTRNAYTLNDGPLSVLRAYRPDEVRELAANAGLAFEASYWTRPAYRYALVFRHT